MHNSELKETENNHTRNHGGILTLNESSEKARESGCASQLSMKGSRNVALQYKTQI